MTDAELYLTAQAIFTLNQKKLPHLRGSFLHGDDSLQTTTKSFQISFDLLR
jgi:hypothetical protein